MQELERKAYIFSVEAIGLAVSLEKEGNMQEQASGFKQSSGKVYTLLTDALEADENKDFADLLRASHQKAGEALRYLEGINPGDDALAEKKDELMRMAGEIIQRLDEILGKIIY